VQSSAGLGGIEVSHGAAEVITHLPQGRDVTPIQRPITVNGSGGLQATDQYGDRREILLHALADRFAGVALHCFGPTSGRLWRDVHPLASTRLAIALGRD
jgi:hypothetical protein